jgi:PKD domain-containing protein
VHNLAIVAVDHNGLRTDSPTRKLRIDTRPPRAALSIHGSRTAGQALRFSVTARDGPRDRSSGVGMIAISFGDGTSASGAHATHSYRGPGAYPVRVTVRDRAGNIAVLREPVRIA